MKNLGAALVTALLVFTLATAWIELVQPRLDLLAQGTAVKPAEAAVTSKKKSRRVEVDAEDEDEVAADDRPPKVARTASRQVKSTRSDGSGSDLTKERLMAQLEEVKQHESRLIAREETLRMLYDDIRLELAAVEDIRRRSATELALAEKKVLEAASNKPGTIITDEPAHEPVPAAKPRLPSESKIATVIQDMASQGNVAAAAALLSGMKDREVAKILTSLSARDPRLALRLSDQIQAARQETLRR